MLTLRTCESNDVKAFGRELYDYYIDNAATFEQVAQSCTEDIFSTFRENEDTPTFALLRIFRYGHHSDLPDDLQALVPANSEYCLALMGSIGIKPEWCRRDLSRNHQVVCAGQASPMFQAAFREFGFDWGEMAHNPGVIANPQQWGMHTFFIPHATGSDAIPQQDAFVKRYRIQSVIGAGSPLIGDTGVLMLGFSTVPLSQSSAAKFSEIAPYLVTVLSQFNQPETLWGWPS